MAPISWYEAVLHANLSVPIQIEVMETFPKQTLRNRCVIVGTNGIQTLTVPVCRSEQKQLTRDVKISYQTRWQHQHWMALVSAYRHTPFFDFLADEFRPFFERETTFLLDLNMGLHEVIMKCLQHTNIKVEFTQQWSGDTELDRYFTEEGVGVRLEPYYQIFADKHGFQPNISIVDKIFNGYIN